MSKGGEGWDGRGDFLYGETEDYYTYIFGFCPPELSPWPAGPEVRPPDWNETASDLDPPPETSEEVCDGVDNDGDGLINKGLPDADGDLVPDDCDNCPYTVNFDQNDRDGDGINDACDNCPEAQSRSDRQGRRWLRRCLRRLPHRSGEGGAGDLRLRGGGCGLGQ